MDIPRQAENRAFWPHVLGLARERDEQGQRSVDLLHRKQFWLKMLPHPLSHLLMLRVASLAPRFQKVRVPADTAHVFRWAGPLPIQTPGIRRLILVEIIILWTWLTIVRAFVCARHTKLMEMRMCPAHRDLQNMVQLMQCQLPWRDNPPPDRWLDLCQSNKQGVLIVIANRWHGFLLS